MSASTSNRQRRVSNRLHSTQRRINRLRRYFKRGFKMRRRRLLQVMWVWLDVAMMGLAALGSAQMLGISLTSASLGILGLMLVVRLFLFLRLGMYRAVLRYSGIHTLVIACIGIVSGTAMAVAAAYFLHFDNTAGMGRVFLVLEGLLSLVACGGSRMAARMVLERIGQIHGKRVLIYGAGDLGELTARDLRRVSGFTPVGFIDDDQHKHRALIHGLPVLGGLRDFSVICQQTRPDLVVMAIDQPPPEVIKAAFQACMERTVRLMRVQGVASSLGEYQRLDLKDLALEDLLPRPSRNLDPRPVQAMLDDRTVLVTGAGGSIGSELCRQIAASGVRKLILLDHSEFNLYAIHGELTDRWTKLLVIPVLCNLACRQTLDQILEEHQPQVVFHAAAYKHVPLVEANPFLGILNNVGGFRNLVEAADAAGVERLVQISTDKAVRPTNVMGATKRVCELLLQNFPTHTTRLCAVRFGNVLGSSGSVVPRFLDQIASGGPVTVTHPDITRYFMLIPEAVALVLQAGALAEHGEIFILDMGEPVRIADMARQLIFMSGHHPDVDIKIAYTGLRPGEKLYEELIIGDTERPTAVNGITVAKPTQLSYPQLIQRIERLLQAASRRDLPNSVGEMSTLVPEWTVGQGLLRGQSTTVDQHDDHLVSAPA